MKSSWELAVQAAGEAQKKLRASAATPRRPGVSYRSEVRFLGCKLPVETFEYTNLDHAKASSALVLKTIRPIFRPFCRVTWQPVT